MAEKPYPMIGRKGFEYYTNGAVEGAGFFGVFEIWKDDEKVLEDKTNESFDSFFNASNAADLAAIEWIDNEVGGD